MASFEEIKDPFLVSAYNLIVNIWKLPVSIYEATGKKLTRGLYQGYGGTFKDFILDSDNYFLLEQLHRNIWRFSAAKTFNQTNSIASLRLDNNGVLKSFNEFKKDAGKLYDIYNETWLETEFNTAIAQANAAANWKDIEAEKGIFPLLRYQTAGDEAVRESHRQYDNIVRPVNDPFWNYAMPPLDYNCRCIVIQETEETAKVTPKKGKVFEVNRPDQKTISIKKLKKDVNSIFRFNPGKEKIIFKDSGKDIHPYFKVEEKYHNYRDRNFGQIIPPAK